MSPAAVREAVQVRPTRYCPAVVALRAQCSEVLKCCKANAARRIRALQEARLASAAGAALPATTGVLARWHSYFTTYATAVSSTLTRLSPSSLTAPIAPAKLREVRRLFQLTPLYYVSLLTAPLHHPVVAV
jgi:hypothetical protein